MSDRPNMLVRAVRRVRGDDAFDIHQDVPTLTLLRYLARRAAMALRGVVLVLRTRRWAFPVFVGRGVSVHHARWLQLSPGVTIEDYCRLDCFGGEGVVLGRGVTLRRNVHIEVTSVLRQPGEGCVIGDRAGISENCQIAAKGRIEIGPETLFGPACLVIAENHVFDDPDRPIREQGASREGISIGGDCWLGGGTKVLDGVSIGDSSVIGAGAVVSKDVPPRSIAVGVPARVIRTR